MHSSILVRLQTFQCLSPRKHVAEDTDWRQVSSDHRPFLLHVDRMTIMSEMIPLY